MSSKQLQIVEQGGAFEVVTSTPPAPGPDEVSVRVSAVGLNPVDWKKWLLGVVVERFPAVIGNEVAGVIEAVGPDVKDFKVGDEVIALTGTTKNGGAFQEIVVMSASAVTRKPRNLTPEEASALPVVYMTAASGVYAFPDGLGLPLPFLKGSDASVNSPIRSILVLGGSSGVGASAIQLLRLSLGADATILTTSSPAHHARLTAELGATAAFDRNSPSLVADIKAATPGGEGVDAIYDATVALLTDTHLFETLSPAGPRIAGMVLGGPPVPVPEGVKKVEISLIHVFGRPGAADLFNTLPELVEAGTFKIPFKVEIVGTGLESIPGAVKKLKEDGVSGQKLVVKL